MRAHNMSTCINKPRRVAEFAFMHRPGPWGAGGWRGGALGAGCGDARWLDTNGERGEDDAEGGRDLPRSYLLSASSCSASAKRGDKEEHL